MKIRSQEKWRELFSQHAASGLSAQRFCKMNNLCPKYFSLRKKQLAWCAPASLPVFVPVVVQKLPLPAPQTTAPSPALRLHHNACLFYFDILPAPEWLAQFVRALP
jgi:hypothetical protein